MMWVSYQLDVGQFGLTQALFGYVFVREGVISCQEVLTFNCPNQLGREGIWKSSF